ncbi:hypothetical protein LX69_01142 [Breznakibacter xylanolyticus]|uniref:Uncharacterized protein n=2 Tax=Breznakibacter xylanolyticus TaxID=990 RepID=A0A2W7NCE9_9BACT|nr:hypothetical protein LX69_01142 [Breznakibacter xylanolyticus]
MVVMQYPHSITITAKGATGIDGDGNPTEGATTVVFTGTCRAEANGTGQLLRGDDGSEMNYSFTVYLPKMETDISANSEAEIIIGNMTIKGSVKRHSNGQLNSRLWV